MLNKHLDYSFMNMMESASVVIFSAVSHIPQFGDANTSLAGDAVSPTGDVDASAGDAHL